MSAPDLQAAVLQTLRRIIPVAPQDIDPPTPFRDQFEMDSLDFLNFVLALEKEHGVKIPEARYPKCATLVGATDVLRDALALTAPEVTPNPTGAPSSVLPIPPQPTPRVG